MMRSTICEACWQGTYVNDVCSSCHSRRKQPSERRPDALKPLTELKNRYVVGDVLGNGGFGITYSSWDWNMKRRVVVKELYPRQDVYRDSDGITVKTVEGQELLFRELAEKFEYEAKLLMMLAGNKNVTDVYEQFQENGTSYYIMEYLDGYDLNTYLSRYGPMSWEKLGPLLEPVMQDLQILHRQNLIHRDISPDNLVLTKKNRLYLIDFGSVRTYRGRESFTVFVKSSFAPWEQYQTNGKQGPWTDIYALSVTIYMLLCGKLPPKAPERVQGKNVIPIETYCPEVPDHVAKAIAKGMSLAINDRFQSAKEFHDALYGAPRPHRSKYCLYGCNGHYKGKWLFLFVNRVTDFGRLGNNRVAFPKLTPGVSRKQCALYVSDSDELYIMDLGSSYGTYLDDVRIEDKWVRVRQDSRIRFGNEEFLVKLLQTGGKESETR